MEDINFLEQNRKEKTLAVVLAMQDEGLTLESALKKNSMTKDEWKIAVRKGYVQSISQTVAREAATLVTQVLLPGTTRRLQILADMAEGKAPKGMRLSPGNVLKAIEIAQAMIAENGDSRQSDLEYLQTFKPQIINITQQSTHIYNGSGNTHTMGQMPSLIEDPEYELVDVNG